MAASITRINSDAEFSSYARIKIYSAKESHVSENIMEFEPFWLLLNYLDYPQIDNVICKVFDAAQKLRMMMEVEDKTSDKFVTELSRKSMMWMEGCLVPHFESSQVLRNGDCVTIKLILLYHPINSGPSVILSPPNECMSAVKVTQTINGSKIASQPNSDTQNQTSNGLNGINMPGAAKSLVQVNSTIHNETNPTVIRQSICDAGAQNNSSLKSNSLCSDSVSVECYDPNEYRSDRKKRKISKHKDNESLSETLSVISKGKMTSSCGETTTSVEQKVDKVKSKKSKEGSTKLNNLSKPQSPGFSLMTPEIQALLQDKIENLSKKCNDEENHKQRDKDDGDTCDFNQENQPQAKKRRRKHKKKHKHEHNEEIEKQAKAFSVCTPPSYKLKLPANLQPQNIRKVFEESDEEAEKNNFENPVIPATPEKLNVLGNTELPITSVLSESKPITSKSHGETNGDVVKLTLVSDNKSKTINESQRNKPGYSDDDSHKPTPTPYTSLTNTLAALWQSGVKDIFDAKAPSPATSPEKKQSNGIATRLSAIANGNSKQVKPQRPIGYSSHPENKFCDFRDRSRYRHRQVITWSGDAIGNGMIKDESNVQVNGHNMQPSHSTKIAPSPTSGLKMVKDQKASPVPGFAHSPRSSNKEERNPLGKVEVTPVGYAFDRIPPLEGLPQEGDCIAFKMMELGEDYTPSLSHFKVGKVVSIDLKTQQVEIELEDQEIKQKRTGRFEMDLGDSDDYLAEQTITTLYGLLQQVRLVQREIDASKQPLLKIF